MSHTSGEQIKTRCGFINCSFIGNLPDASLAMLHDKSSSAMFSGPLREYCLQQRFVFLTMVSSGCKKYPVQEALGSFIDTIMGKSMRLEGHA